MLEGLRRGIADGKSVIQNGSGKEGRFDLSMKEMRRDGSDDALLGYTAGTMIGDLIACLSLVNPANIPDVIVKIDEEGKPKVK